MAITPTTLTRGAAVAAVVAGLLFVGIQIGHPHLDAGSITSTEVQIRGSLKFVMAVLALVGVTGMYLSQVRRNGIIGLIGYLVLATGYLLITCMTYLAAFVLPQLATTDAAYVDDAIDVVVGRATTADVGLFATAVQVQNVSFLAGGLIFGIALYRAGVLARWATILLAVGGVVTILLSVLPDAFYRLLAFPNGIAMVGLGVSLWLTARTENTTQPTDVHSPRLTGASAA
jgi:TM2 domain-containing membrane protein YozV